MTLEMGDGDFVSGRMEKREMAEELLQSVMQGLDEDLGSLEEQIATAGRELDRVFLWSKYKEWGALLEEKLEELRKDNQGAQKVQLQLVDRESAKCLVAEILGNPFMYDHCINLTAPEIAGVFHPDDEEEISGEFLSPFLFIQKEDGEIEGIIPHEIFQEFRHWTLRFPSKTSAGFRLLSFKLVQEEGENETRIVKLKTDTQGAVASAV